MAAVDYVKFDQFVEDLGAGVHDLQATGDTIEVYLTNTAPTVASDAVYADLPGITEENGYAAADIQNTFSQSSGTATFAGVDVVWTASGGSFGPFRYAVLRNGTQTSPLKPLIAYYDYGESITITDSYPFTVDFSTAIFTFA
jgi:hypothetical protein